MAAPSTEPDICVDRLVRFGLRYGGQRRFSFPVQNATDHLFSIVCPNSARGDKVNDTKIRCRERRRLLIPHQVHRQGAFGSTSNRIRPSTSIARRPQPTPCRPFAFRRSDRTILPGCCRPSPAIRAGSRSTTHFGFGIADFGLDPPGARARRQQTDMLSEAIRWRVLNRLVVLDGEPDGLESALVPVVARPGEPSFSTPAACTAIFQEWEMVRLSPRAPKRMALFGTNRPVIRRAPFYNRCLHKHLGGFFVGAGTL